MLNFDPRGRHPWTLYCRSAVILRGGGGSSQVDCAGGGGVSEAMLLKLVQEPLGGLFEVSQSIDHRLIAFLHTPGHSRLDLLQLFGGEERGYDRAWGVWSRAANQNLPIELVMYWPASL
jgi:hypothetical protein